VKVLKSIQPLTPAQVVRGQFRGYRQEPGVAADSQVETFAAVRLEIENERWAGVPISIRVGKCLPVTATEIMVYLQREPQPIFGELEPECSNYFRFRISPEVTIALTARVKKPGEALHGEQLELCARHQGPDDMEPYERLLTDALHGDVTLFTREDGVEAAWRVVDPILGDATRLEVYEPSTWGPPAADRLVPSGAEWHDPVV
jgi:glucose-6-phosphate 1-dehydrogenase